MAWLTIPTECGYSLHVPTCITWHVYAVFHKTSFHLKFSMFGRSVFSFGTLQGPCPVGFSKSVDLRTNGCLGREMAHTQAPGRFQRCRSCRHRFIKKLESFQPFDLKNMVQLSGKTQATHEIIHGKLCEDDDEAVGPLLKNPKTSIQKLSCAIVSKKTWKGDPQEMFEHFHVRNMIFAVALGPKIGQKSKDVDGYSWEDGLGHPKPSHWQLSDLCMNSASNKTGYLVMACYGCVFYDSSSIIDDP